MEAEILVKFLGNDYIFPEELKRYISYCNEFEKINNSLSQALLATMNKKPVGENGEPDAADDIESTLKEKMRQEGKKIISMLAEQNIFDITESELIDNNKGYILYEQTYKLMIEGLKQNLIEELNSFVAGWEDARQSAYSQVTGTGITMYSNSMIAHMTLAAFETSTIKKQCEKADRDYEMAMDALERKGSSIREKKDIEVMLKTFAGVAEAFGMFVSELMETYLNKLQENSIFDYSKVKPYNIKRSSELLNNLSMVEDKKSVLEQAFKNCPYNPDIYANVLDYGMCDVATFATAKEFYQDSLLISLIEDYCKKNLKEYDKVKEPIAVLALYKGSTEREILRFLYGSELDSVENNYHTFANILINQRELDKWIRQNISQCTEEIVKISSDKVKDKVHLIVTGVISEKSYQKFTDMELLSAETIRLNDSVETYLDRINAEFEKKIVACIDAYIQEAKARMKRYAEAYDKFSVEVKKKNNAITEKRNELNSLGMFAFTKKKELKSIIFTMESELSEFKEHNEPKDLKEAFEKMYSE